MIIVFLGNVGSGKTVCAVRHIVKNSDRIETYANITFKGLKGVYILKPEMIINKKIASTINHKDGSTTTKYNYKLNLDFWKRQKKKFSVVIDEFHNIANARLSSSKQNIIFNKWLTLIRRILGSSSGEDGELILISQLSNQIDLIARELCHQVRYHVCHYKKACNRCGCIFRETSESPEPIKKCPRCNYHHMKKYNHRVEVWKFVDMNKFRMWYENRIHSFYSHYYINDIENYFKYYNTYQWDNLFEDY